jgi:hypothetical protein
LPSMSCLVFKQLFYIVVDCSRGLATILHHRSRGSTCIRKQHCFMVYYFAQLGADRLCSKATVTLSLKFIKTGTPRLQRPSQAISLSGLIIKE